MELRMYVAPEGRSSVDTYRTRYRINRVLQKRHLARDVLAVNCFPCIAAEKTTVRSLARDSLRSVFLLFALKTVVLAIGVCKEALDLRQEEDTTWIHTACTIIETVVACLLVITHAVFIVTLYTTNQKGMHQHVISDDDESVNSTGSELKAMETWVKVYVGFSAGLVFFMLASYLVCHFFLHHGWSLLSNNACVIAITAVSTIHQRRIIRQMALLREDEQKMATHEALLLLEEAKASRDIVTAEVFARAEHLRKDVTAASALFSIPDYVWLTGCTKANRQLSPDNVFITQKPSAV